MCHDHATCVEENGRSQCKCKVRFLILFLFGIAVFSSRCERLIMRKERVVFYTYDPFKIAIETIKAPYILELSLT